MDNTLDTINKLIAEADRRNLKVNQVVVGHSQMNHLMLETSFGLPYATHLDTRGVYLGGTLVVEDPLINDIILEATK